MKASIIGLVLTVVFYASTVFAASIKGAGASSCGLWIEDRKKNSYFEQINWVLGFISAYNKFLYNGKHPNGIFGNSDYNAIALWLDNYCSQNPLETLYQGVIPLSKNLGHVWANSHCRSCR